MGIRFARFKFYQVSLNNNTFICKRNRKYLYKGNSLINFQKMINIQQRGGKMKTTLKVLALMVLAIFTLSIVPLALA